MFGKTTLFDLHLLKFGGFFKKFGDFPELFLDGKSSRERVDESTHVDLQQVGGDDGEGHHLPLTVRGASSDF